MKEQILKCTTIDTPRSVVKFDSHGDRLLLVDDKYNVRLISKNGNTIKEFPDYTKDFRRHIVNISALFDRQGHPLLFAWFSDTIYSIGHIFDEDSNKSHRFLINHTDRVSSVKFSPDGLSIITTSGDSTITILDFKTGEVKVSIDTGGRCGVRLAEFSPDGSIIVGSSFSASTEIWDAKTGEPLIGIYGHEEWINSAKFSPDGQYVVTTSDDCTAKKWDVKTGKCVLTIKGSGKSLYAATFSLDGRFILTVDSEKTASIWEADSGKFLMNLPNHVIRAKFDSEYRIITTCSDKTIRIWDLSMFL
jgi:WD40 repeat protein